MTDWLEIPAADLPKVIPATRRAMFNVTDRELQVVQCMAKGMTNKQSGRELRLSSRTIEIHRSNIKWRTGLKSIAQIIIAADRIFREERAT
jgi:DNA-binding NarL/FixJ family response regulator